MISVCITTYNGEKYIKEQITSVLTQIGDNDEVIVSDDGSTDKTISIIEAFKDERIKVVLHDKHLVVKSIYKFDLTTRNMENALRYSTGDYVFMADQDDIWSLNRVETILPLLDVYSLVVNDCKIIDKECNVISESYFEMINSKSGLIKNFYCNSYLGCCMAFKRSFFKYIMPFPKTPIPHDIWIGLLSEIYGSVFFCNEKLVFYRRHGHNLSHSAGTSDNSFVFKLRYRILIFKALVLRLLSRKRYNAI